MPDQYKFKQFLHSAIPLGLSFAICAFSLSKKNSRPYLTLLAITTSVFIAFWHSADLPFGSYCNTMTAAIIPIFLAHQINLHCIISQESLGTERARSRSSRPSGKPANGSVPESASKHDPSGNGRDWIFGYKMLFNVRLLGTQWQVPTVRSTPPSARRSSSADISKLNGSIAVIKTSRSRSVFLLRRAGIMLCRYLALCLYWDPSLFRRMPDGKPWSLSDFSPEKRYLLSHLWRSLFTRTLGNRQALVRAAVIRFHLLLATHLEDYLTVSAQHDFLALTAVASHLDNPEDWPYLYGDVREAYTVRGYWGKFWHLLVYRSFSAFAASLSSRLPFFRRASRSTLRFCNNSLVFVISGLMHSMVEWNVAPDQCSRCGCWGVFWKFVAQIGAITLEEVFQALSAAMIRRVIPKSVRTNYAPWLNRLRKVVGYIWVISFMTWVEEVTVMPFRYCVETLDIA